MQQANWHDRLAQHCEGYAGLDRHEVKLGKKPGRPLLSAGPKRIGEDPPYRLFCFVLAINRHRPPDPAGKLPRVVEPGWRLTSSEGVGEVQTPLRATRGAERRLAVGDRVWFRHAKAGELMERFDRVHLVRGDQVVEEVPTYRGEGRNFG